jgi:hypothetical protein
MADIQCIPPISVVLETLDIASAVSPLLAQPPPSPPPFASAFAAEHYCEDECADAPSIGESESKSAHLQPRLAVWHCTECGIDFCTACFERVHRSLRLAKHVRKAVADQSAERAMAKPAAAAAAPSSSRPLMLEALLEQGAIAAAGGGFSLVLLDCLDKSIVALRAASKRCKAVSAHWRGHANVYQCVDSLASCFPAVTSMYVYPTVVESEWMTALGRGGQLRALTEISFNDIRRVPLSRLPPAAPPQYSNAWLAAVASLPKLTALTLPPSMTMTGAGIRHILLAKHLQRLDCSLARSEMLTDDNVGDLLRYSLALRELSLTVHSRLSDEAFVHARCCHSLTALHVSHFPLTPLGVEMIASAPALTTLDFSVCQWIDGAAIAHLASCKLLAQVRLVQCLRVTDHAFTTLAALPALTLLDISECYQHDITDAAFVALSQSRTLTTLQMAHCSQATITHVACEAIAAMPALTRLDVRGCEQLSERAFAALARSLTLTELNAGGCVRMSILNGMGTSCSLQRLEAVDARPLPVPSGSPQNAFYLQEAAVAHLARCSTLRYLDLSTTVETDSEDEFRVLHALSDCAALETLVLTAPLALEGCDVGVLERLVAALPQLRELKLCVSDALVYAKTGPCAALLAKLRQFRDECEAKRRGHRLHCDSAAAGGAQLSESSCSPGPEASTTPTLLTARQSSGAVAVGLGLQQLQQQQLLQWHNLRVMLFRWDQFYDPVLGHLRHPVLLE